MKRLFAALKFHPDKSFLASFNKLKFTLQHEQIKWVEEKNIHITLKFFGDTDERKIPVIREVLSALTPVFTSFEISLQNLGVFGSSYSPKVIWTGIEPYADVSRLMQILHHDLEGVGFLSDRQNLIPHLTLGRIRFLKDRILFRKIIDQHGKIQSAPEKVSEIILFESILRHDGPDYRIIDRFPLA